MALVSLAPDSLCQLETPEKLHVRANALASLPARVGRLRAFKGTFKARKAHIQRGNLVSQKVVMAVGPLVKCWSNVLLVKCLSNLVNCLSNLPARRSGPPVKYVKRCQARQTRQTAELRKSRPCKSRYFSPNLLGT